MDGTTVVVTGGSRGLGRSVAEAFAESNATVVVAARDAAELEETVARICRRCSHQPPDGRSRRVRRRTADGDGLPIR